MLVSLAQPLGLIAIVAPIAAVAAWRWRPPPLRPWGRRASLSLRLTLLLSLVLALSGLQVGLPSSARTIVAVVDRSASDRSSIDTVRASLGDIQRGLATDDRLGIVAFGRDAVVDTPPDHDPHFTDFGSAPNPNYTDIAGALRLAASIIPDDSRRHIVLYSDGRQNLGDAVAEARRLNQDGTRVDVVPAAASTGPEVRIDAVQAPTAIPPRANAHVRVVIVSNVSTTARLTVDVDGVPVSQGPQAVGVGETDAELDLPAATPGFHTVRATIDPAQDTVTENNTASALIEVLGTQRVLVVEGQPGAGTNVSAALRAAAVDTTVVAPNEVPTAAARLAGFQAVALVDVPASALQGGRMEALVAAARDLGVGLSVFGGPNTLGPGGFSGTPLEAALPVDMRITNDAVKPPVAVVLVLESVESSQGDAVVRGAARSLVERLSPHDLVGVTDSATGLVVPLQEVGGRTAVEKAIDAVGNFGDPPSYEPYLSAAEKALASHPEATKHVILLGDGDTPPVSPQLIADMVAHHITVSSVGVNIDQSPQNMANMKAVADQGHGHFYESSSPSQVPDILLQESADELKPWVVEQTFLPTLGEPTSALAGIDLQHFPAIDGYVATTAKANADVALSGPSRDPLLVQGQHGLGRTAVWTSDTEGRWSTALLRSPQGGRLLANIVGSTLPLAADPSLTVATTVTGDQAQIVVSAMGAPPDASVTADVLNPDKSEAEVGLTSTAPGRFAAQIPADQVGSYLMRISMRSHGQVVHATTAGLAVSYSPEFRFAGTDDGFLGQLAAAGGGALLHSAREILAAAPPPHHVQVSLSLPLVMLATLLLPLDVAVRRLTLRAADLIAVAANRRERQRRRRAPPSEDAALARLRSRVGAVRAARRDAPPPEEDLATRLRRRRQRPR